MSTGEIPTWTEPVQKASKYDFLLDNIPDWERLAGLVFEQVRQGEYPVADVSLHQLSGGSLNGFSFSYHEVNVVGEPPGRKSRKARIQVTVAHGEWMSRQQEVQYFIEKIRLALGEYYASCKKID